MSMKKGQRTIDNTGTIESTMDVDVQQEDQQNMKIRMMPKKGKKAKKQKRVVIAEDEEEEEREAKPVIRILSMRNLEILVLGGAKTGKSCLVQRLLQSPEEKKRYFPKVGMTIYKKEHILTSGETIRLCVWDPAIRSLPKDIKDKKVKKVRAEKNGFCQKLLYGDIWDLIKGSDEKTPLPIDGDTNDQLAQDYLWSGTYHIALFVFDLTNAESFQEMEDWLDIFVDTCSKSSQVINMAIVGTKLDLVEKDPSLRAVPLYVLNEWILELEGELSWNSSTLKYFEVSSLQDKNTTQLLRYVLEKGQEKHKLVENKRYNRVDKTQGRDCGLSCNIF